MPSRITSWVDLQAEVAKILQILNSNPALALASAANPVLAIEHLDYVIDAEVRPAIADRLRLGEERSGKIGELRTEISRLAGRSVNPDSAEDLRRLLDELGITPRKPSPRPADHTFESSSTATEQDVSPPRWRPGGPGQDPLAGLKDQHQVMVPLLEYRRLSASAPPFAPQHIFAAVLAGKKKPAVTAATGRLQQSPRRGPTTG